MIIAHKNANKFVEFLEWNEIQKTQQVYLPIKYY